MRKFKIVILLLLILISTFRSSAQSSIGFRAGLSLSKMIYAVQGLSINTDRLPAFTAGIPLEFQLSQYFSLQPELNYITKGGKSTSSDNYGGNSYSAESSLKINYLELPVYGKFSVGNSKIKLDLFAGPVFAYGLSGSSYIKEIDNGTVHEQTQKLNFKDDQVNRFDFSVNIGAGTSLAFGPNRLFLDIHYQAGLTNMDTSDQSGNTSGAFTVKNNIFIFSVGMFTPLSSPKPKPQPVVK